MSTANELWLEDMSLKLLCVFALDRFGDFITDEVGTLFKLFSPHN
jgi:TATA-binding protein-associated factor